MDKVDKLNIMISRALKNNNLVLALKVSRLRGSAIDREWTKVKDFSWAKQEVSKRDQVLLTIHALTLIKTLVGSVCQVCEFVSEECG